MMTYKPAEVTKMVKEIASKHSDELDRLMVEWEIREVSHPRCQEKIQYLVPIVLMEWRY